MPAVPFDAACALLDAALSGGARREILEPLAASASFAAALRQLRAGMRGHVWKPAAGRIALAHAVSMGSHLRFGFEASYGRDTVVMRDDNVADYPWLCFALRTVTDEYARLVGEGASDEDKAPLAEAILNGLSADARAF